MTEELSQSPIRRESGRFYRPELDALRFCAFALVFISHTLPPAVKLGAFNLPAWISTPMLGMKEGGGYGVDVFFMLSAYLITEILLREHRRTGAISVGAFWVRRILRIWPLYYAFLALAFWVIPHLYEQTFPAFHAVAYATFWGNFALIMRPEEITTAAGILWSVSIEEQFYLLWPLVLRYFLPRLRLICLALILVSTGLRAWLVYTGVDSIWSLWANTFTRFEPIAIGALIAIGLNGRTPVLKESTRLAGLLGGLLLIVVLGGWIPRAGTTALIAYPLATFASALMLLSTLGTTRLIPSSLLYLGRISYGLYVFHIFAIRMVQRHIQIGSTFIEWPTEFIAAFAFTVLLASISYRWYEKPFLRLKDRFSRADARGTWSDPTLVRAVSATPIQ